jgi:hypothetical protein
MIYLLKTSPYNEEFILAYATCDAEIEAIARSYVHEYFDDNVEVRVTIDRNTGLLPREAQPDLVVAHWFAEGETEDEDTKTFYLVEVNKV